MYREIISKIGLGYILEFGQFHILSLYYMVFDCGFWEIFALYRFSSIPLYIDLFIS